MGVPKSSTSNVNNNSTPLSSTMSSSNSTSQQQPSHHHRQQQQQQQPDTIIKSSSATTTSTTTTISPTTAPPPLPTTRLPNTTICMPIVYGSIAFPLAKVEEYHTHQWTLYVRGPQNEDLSVGIAKVVFQLHPSFPQPVRELTAPPFEVTEKGWGEFEATIRIVWREASEKAVVLSHFIKLYPPPPEVVAATAGAVVGVGTAASASGASVVGTATGSTGRGTTTVQPHQLKESNDNDGTTITTNAALQKKKLLEPPPPVIHEFYDEVVFTNPIRSFASCLLRGSPSNTSSNSSSDVPSSTLPPKVQSHEPSVQSQFKTYDDEEDARVLLEAQKFLEAELQSVKERILIADGAKKELDEAIAVVMVKLKGSGGSAGGVLAGSGGGMGGKRKKSGGGGGGGGASKKSAKSQ